MKKALIYILALAWIAIATGGCNTTEGFGKDMEKAGKKIQKEAN